MAQQPQSVVVPALAPSPDAVAEIRAYIAIRDGLLDEAEVNSTRAKLDAVTVANDLVTACVRAARPPYGAQCLPEAEASQERKRCEGIRRHIAELRSLASMPSRRAA